MDGIDGPATPEQVAQEMRRRGLPAEAWNSGGGIVLVRVTLPQCYLLVDDHEQVWRVGFYRHAEEDDGVVAFTDLAAAEATDEDVADWLAGLLGRLGAVVPQAIG